MLEPCTVDFETKRIEKRPQYPPRPVGVSIAWPGKRPMYYAWGHPSKNNCTEGRAKRELDKCSRFKAGVAYHNAKFDIDVCREHLGINLAPSWERVHDTQFLLYLDDPHQRELSLKPSAERLLGMAPSEQEAVRDWLIANQPVPGVRLHNKGKNSAGYWAGHISHAPGSLVGAYAMGDVVRTAKLWRKLIPSIERRGMVGAYNRERELCLNLLDMEKRGVPVDVEALEADVRAYNVALERVENWMRRRLKVGESFNFQAPQKLVEALIKARLVNRKDLGTTESGKVAADKETLGAAIKDPEFLSVLSYRRKLGKYVSTFMEPWLEVARTSGGLIFPIWHQTRTDENGARTGRMSSTPNVQNIPQEPAALFREHLPIDKRRGSALPHLPIKNLPALPKVRKYIVPFKGHALINRDYSQQEFRIVAHYEDGQLLASYQKEPWTDMHEYAQVMIGKLLGREIRRKDIKTMGFGLIYGMGVGLLAERMGCTVREARDVKNAYLDVIPGIRALYSDMKELAANKQPFRTWGGREYYCEPPAIVDGQFRTFDYKMVNYLVQGGAADCTKEAVNNYYRTKPRNHHLLAVVHDELLSSVPFAALASGMRTMRRAMESVKFDVAMLSEGTYSLKNWADKRPFDSKGVTLYAA